MEEPPLESDDRWSEQFAHTLATGRERLQGFATSYRQRLAALEEELSRSVGQIGEGLARDRQQADQRLAEVQTSRQEIEAAQAQLKQDERALAQLRRELENDTEDLARQRGRLQEKLADVDQLREELEAERAETKAQRRRIAQELKEQRQAQQKELERERAELERREVIQAAGETSSEELEALRRRCAGLEQELAGQTAAAREAAGQIEALEAQRSSLEQSVADPGHLAERLAEAEGALAEARQRLADTERELAEARERPAEIDASDQSAELADMQRRYELAMEDLRELKKRNADLEKRLASSSSSGGGGGGGETLDWEAQKRRMLAALEAGDNESEDDRSERLRMTEVLNKTEAVIVVKDQQIAMLKQQLEDQAGSLGSAADATAREDILAQDEVVQAERERLKQLQLEWENKLRQAEIDLSLDRAKIGRERAEIDERLRVLEELASRVGDVQRAVPGKQAKKPPRGRWLTRLGLKEQGEE